MQANYTHVTTGSAPKMHFSDICGPYMVRTLYGPYMVILAPQNNSTVQFSDRVSQLGI